MSPQLTIITAAMSLGGMGAVGWNHYDQVEKEVTEYHSEKKEEQQQVEVSEMGTELKNALVKLEENLRLEGERERKEQANDLQNLMVEMEQLKQRQSAYSVLVSSLSQEQESLGFKVESLSGKFIPLRSTGGRFQPVKTDLEGAHPLLPPVENSWTKDY